MKHRVLFVDDEPMVLSGLRRTLRGLKAEWDMSFAGSGQEALDLLASGSFTAVISDMRMPGMDGAQLLNQVAETYPATARMVLSGHADLEAVLRAVRPAHQYFAKPCEPAVIQTALNRIAAVRDDGQLGAMCLSLGVHRRLPSTQASIDRMQQCLESPSPDAAAILEVIQADIAMTVQVLRVVNSAFFGPATATFDVKQALTVLGGELLQKLLNDVVLFRTTEAQMPGADQAVEHWNRLVGDVASTIPESPGAPEARTRVMLALCGPLAALETDTALDDHASKALSRMLLSFWGLDIDIAEVFASPLMQTELREAV